MRDNLGRELVSVQTQMAQAFLDARAPFKSPSVVAMVADAIRRGRGNRKVPAWTVTRKGGR